MKVSTPENKLVKYMTDDYMSKVFGDNWKTQMIFAGFGFVVFLIFTIWTLFI